MDKIMPLNCIRQLQFQKYKTAMLPILIIIAGFILRLSGIVLPMISLLMGLSLAAYLIILFIFRMGNPTIPEKENLLLSPVHGKVLSVERANSMVKIRIAKSFFDPIEIRCPLGLHQKVDETDIVFHYGVHEIQMSFGSKDPLIFNEHGMVRGSLLGLLRGSYYIILTMNEAILSRELNIKKDDVVVAGQTVLAELISQ
jgi:hypothetical protein